MPDLIQTVQPPTMAPQTAQEKADASAAWLAQEHPEWNQQASSAEQAAAMNAAWQNNTAPVLPRMGTQYSGDQNETIRIYDTTGLTDPRNQQGVARDVTRSEYIQLYGRTPEQSEAAKYQEFNAPINFAAYANVPLSQMPANIASRVQDYYATNPSAAYREQIALYGRNVGTVATTGPAESYKQGSFAPTVAAGEGGFTGRAAAYAASWTPLVHSAMYGQESTIERTSVVAPPAMMDITIAPGRNVYVPIGETSQQLRADAKLVVAASGAYEVWQTPKNTMPGSEFVRIYPMITTGGSDYALQSGMISGKAATPVIYSEFGLQPLWKESEAARVADIQAHPEQYSRLGSELYGGIVQKLLPEPYNSIEVAWGRGQTVEPGVYPAVRQNYASLVNFEDVNAPKGTVSNAADLPKFGAFSPEEYASMSSIQRVAIGGGLPPAMSEDLLPQPFRSTSTAAVAGTASTDSFSYTAPAEVSQAAGRPSTPLTVFGPEVEAWGKGAAGAVAAAIFPPVAVAAGVSKISSVMQPPAESTPVPGTDFVYRTDPAAVIMEGALYYGDTLLFGAATPGKDLLKSQGQAENLRLSEFNTDFAKVTAQRETYTALGSTIETQRAGLGKMLEGKINTQGQFTGSPEEYAKYQTSLSELNANVEKYNQYGEQYKDVLSKGFASGAIIKSGEGFVVNPSNEHPYGAFSDWSASVTKTLRGGVTEADIIRYEQSPEFKSAGPVMQFGEGAWKMATKPTELAGFALQGIEVYATMGLADVGLAALGARGAAMSGTAGGALETAGFGGQRVLQSGAFQYGLGGLLVGGSVWSATEGFTAPAEKAWSRGGELSVSLAAMGWGGLSPEGAAALSRVQLPNLGIGNVFGGRPTGGGPGGEPAPGGGPMGGGGPTGPVDSGPIGGGPIGSEPMGGGPAPSGGWSFTDFTNPIGRQSRVYNSNIEDWYRPPPTEGGGAAALPPGEATRPTVEWTFAKEIPMSQEPAVLSSGTSSYNIRRVFDETYVPSPEKLPSMSEDMFTAGSALDVGSQRLIATSDTGQVVGATAFEIRGNEIFVKSMGSRQAGVGTAMTQELTDIAGRYGATKITGESRPQAVGFWEKMGADVMVPEGGKGAYPFEIRVGGETRPVSSSDITSMSQREWQDYFVAGAAGGKIPQAGTPLYDIATARGQARLDITAGAPDAFRTNLLYGGKPADYFIGSEFTYLKSGEYAKSLTAISEGAPGGVHQFGGYGDYWTQVNIGSGKQLSGAKAYVTMENLAKFTPESASQFSSLLKEGGFEGSFKLPSSSYDAAGRFENIVLYEKSIGDLDIGINAAKDVWGGNVRASYGKDTGGRSSTEIRTSEMGSQIRALRTISERYPGQTDILSDYLSPRETTKVSGVSPTTETPTATISTGIRPVAEPPVPGSATNLERIQYALRYNEPQKTIDAMEYIRGRYPEQEAIWERYATDIQQLEPVKPGRGQELQPQKETIDLRPVVDLRPYMESAGPSPSIQTKMEIDLTNTPAKFENPTQYSDRYATPAERNMVFEQYGFTPAEIDYAKMGKASLNDVLDWRQSERFATTTEREMIFQQYEFTPAEIEFAKLNKASLNDILARRESVAQPMRAMEPMRGTYGTQEPARVFETTSREDYLINYSRENYLQDYSREFEISGTISGTRSMPDVGTIPDTIGRTIPSEDYARVFKTSSISPPDTMGDTRAAQDYARTFGTIGIAAVAAVSATASAQTTDLDFARTFDQIPTPDQPGKGSHWVRGWETDVPPPTPPPTVPPLWGSVGGQGPGLGGKKRGSRKYLEYFPVGLDISTFGVQRGANPFTSGLGRLKYLPRDVGVVSTPGVARERSNRLVERKVIAMKAIPVKGKRKNIFMK